MGLAKRFAAGAKKIFRTAESAKESNALETRMLAARDKLPPEQADAYYQLLEFPVSVMANLYRMYYGVAWNRKLAASNDPRANYFATEVETAYARDCAFTDRYHSINGGKWDGMMGQVHMNYAIWNDPTQQTMPSVIRVGGDRPDGKRQRPHPPARHPSP